MNSMPQQEVAKMIQTATSSPNAPDQGWPQWRVLAVAALGWLAMGAALAIGNTVAAWSLWGFGAAGAAWQVWRLVQRNEPSADAAILVAGIAATCLALLVAGKVLSPQFLVWIVPGAVLILGRYGKAAIWVTIAALLVTQAYFPQLYWHIVALEAPEMGILIVRDILLIVLLALCWPRQGVADEALAMADGTDPTPRKELAPA